MALAILSDCPLSISGKPYSQPPATRCAVEASITRVVSLVMSETLSRAASSGRHRMATSAALRNSARACGSLRRSTGAEMISMSSRPDSRDLICRPVVPCSPSMKTFGFMPSNSCVRCPGRDARRRCRPAARGARPGGRDNAWRRPNRRWPLCRHDHRPAQPPPRRRRQDRSGRGG